jgi:hypothetical protein
MPCGRVVSVFITASSFVSYVAGLTRRLCDRKLYALSTDARYVDAVPLQSSVNRKQSEPVTFSRACGRVVSVFITASSFVSYVAGLTRRLCDRRRSQIPDGRKLYALSTDARYVDAVPLQSSVNRKQSEPVTRCSSPRLRSSRTLPG